MVRHSRFALGLIAVLILFSAPAYAAVSTSQLAVPVPAIGIRSEPLVLVQIVPGGKVEVVIPLNHCQPEPIDLMTVAVEDLGFAGPVDLVRLLDNQGNVLDEATTILSMVELESSVSFFASSSSPEVRIDPVRLHVPALEGNYTLELLDFNGRQLAWEGFPIVRDCVWESLQCVGKNTLTCAADLSNPCHDHSFTYAKWQLNDFAADDYNNLESQGEEPMLASSWEVGVEYASVTDCSQMGPTQYGDTGVGFAIAAKTSTGTGLLGFAYGMEYTGDDDLQCSNPNGQGCSYVGHKIYASEGQVVMAEPKTMEATYIGLAGDSRPHPSCSDTIDNLILAALGEIPYLGILTHLIPDYECPAAFDTADATILGDSAGGARSTMIASHADPKFSGGYFTWRFDEAGREQIPFEMSYLVDGSANACYSCGWSSHNYYWYLEMSHAIQIL